MKDETIATVAIIICVVALLLACVASTVNAGPICRGEQRAVVARQNVVLQNGLVVVPFAVPVAVPVATVNVPTVLYSFDGNPDYQARPHVMQAVPNPDIAAMESPSLVRRKCAKCHGGPSPKAGLDLSKPAALTTKQRLAAVARVVSDDPEERMPKGGTLSPAEIGRVLQELSRSE